MIFIFDEAGDRLPITWQGLDFNSAFADSDPFDVGEQEGIFVDSVAYNTPVNFQSEVESDIVKRGGGIEYYNPRVSSRVLNIRARIQCRSMFKLGSHLAHIQKLFSPLHLQSAHNTWPPAAGTPPWADPWSTYYQPLQFTHLDDDSFKAASPAGGFMDAAHFPSGKVLLEHAVVPMELPDPPMMAFGTGWGASLDLSLLVMGGGVALGRDVWTRTGDGTLIADWANVPMWPKIFFRMDGAGSATLTIAIASDHTTLPDYSIVLNASGLVNNDEITIDTRDRVIYKNGVINNGLYVSGSYPILAPAGYTNTITWSNTTNVESNSNVVSMKETLSA